MDLQENLDIFNDFPELDTNTLETQDSTSTLSEDLVDLSRNDKAVYKVFYTKSEPGKSNPLKRGILIASLHRLDLKDETGQSLAENSNPFKSIFFQVDQELRLGTYEIDIDKLVPISGQKVKISKICRSSIKLNPKAKEAKPRASAASSVSPISPISIPYEAMVIDKDLFVFIEQKYAKNLRDYQAEGVEFLYSCISGKRSQVQLGCILADHMGLGKTLTTLSLIYALTRKESKSPIKKVLIVTPASLLRNWSIEINKWFGEKISHKILESGKENSNLTSIKLFSSGKLNCLLCGYEFFVTLKGKIDPMPDLVICDEGQRLKNHNTLTYKSIMNIKTSRRILLTGTPLQNDIKEYYCLVNIVNYNALGSWEVFRIRYADPIYRGQSPYASAVDVQVSDGKSNEIWKKTQSFVLRRTAEKIFKRLPARHEYVVLINLNQLQEQLYCSYLGSDIVDDVNNNVFRDVFALITALRKIVSHPDLIYHRKASENALLKEHQRALALFPEDYLLSKDRTAYSPKLKLTMEIVNFACESAEKVIVASYWNKNLDFVQEALSKESFKFYRVEGSTPAHLRTQIIDQFNADRNFVVLLLSCKAGGTGLNIVGASRMIMYDVDWNPKNDQQAMARIWRPGQNKEVHIYRLITVGTIEEKIYQKQISKENLSLHLIDRCSISKLDSHFIKELFKYSPTPETFESGDKPSDHEASWMDNFKSYFTMFKKVQAEWEKLQIEDCLIDPLNFPSETSDSLDNSDHNELEFMVKATKKAF